MQPRVGNLGRWGEKKWGKGWKLRVREGVKRKEDDTGGRLAALAV